jgi:hypothetical protein
MGQDTTRIQNISCNIHCSRILSEGCFPKDLALFKTNFFHLNKYKVGRMHSRSAHIYKHCSVFLKYIVEHNQISNTSTFSENSINLLKPSGNFTYHQVQHSIILHSAHITFTYFVHISEQTAASAVNISNSVLFYNRGWKCLLRGTHRAFI